MNEQPLPFGHQKVKWRGARPGRCGQGADGLIVPGFCGKEFRFKACEIAGALVVANCCNQCTLKYDIAHATTPGLKLAWATELAELIGCGIIDAIEVSEKAFPRYKADLRPKKPTDPPEDPGLYE
jgi:hypothetical protein